MASVSRVMRDVSSSEHMQLRDEAVNIMAAYKNAEDMITIGAYVDGSDAAVDQAKRLMPKINKFLRQQIKEKKDFPTSVAGLREAMGAKKGGKS